MGVRLTEAAAERAKKFDKGLGLRFGVRRTGCSGFAYVLKEAESVKPSDHVFGCLGVEVRVDPASLELVDGTTIDYRRRGLGEQFVFNNPNVEAECGCGESFTTGEKR